MKHIELENRKTEIITDVTCDSCGKSCKVDEAIVDNDLRSDHGTSYRTFEYMTLSANWGYYSTDGKDLTNWTAHICEDCIDKHMSFIKFTKTKIRI